MCEIGQNPIESSKHYRMNLHAPMQDNRLFDFSNYTLFSWCL